MNEENNKNVNDNQVPEKDLSDKVIESVENFMNTADHEKDYDKNERAKHRTEAILSYIPFVSLYYIFTRKHKSSEYLKFHTNQGLLVTLLWTLCIIISTLLITLFKRDSYIRNDVPGIISFISYLLYSISFLTSLFGAINTANDSSKELPLIGKIKILK